jgi:hypothetical protein
VTCTGQIVRLTFLHFAIRSIHCDELMVEVRLGRDYLYIRKSARMASVVGYTLICYHTVTVTSFAAFLKHMISKSDSMEVWPLRITYNFHQMGKGTISMAGYHYRRSKWS